MSVLAESRLAENAGLGGREGAHGVTPVRVWRGWGGWKPTLNSVEFDRQLDKLSIWLDNWNHQQRCAVLETLIEHSTYKQLQFLWTVIQPALHRDFMYTARTHYPSLAFTPISTHTSRELKKKEKMARIDNYYRISSAHLQHQKQAKEINHEVGYGLNQDVNQETLLPHLSITSSSQSTVTKATSYSSQQQISPSSIVGGAMSRSHTLPRLTHSKPGSRSSKMEMLSFGERSKTSIDLHNSTPSVRFVEMPVRRHIQEEVSCENLISGLSPHASPSSLLQKSPTELSLRDRKKKKTMKKNHSKENASKEVALNSRNLPQDGMQLVQWYLQSWNDTQQNEFLHKLLLKLDPRQHYFISSILSVKQYKDFIELLPAHISLRILSYLNPVELLRCSRVSKTWYRLCNDNELWRIKCLETRLEIPILTKKPNWKKIFRENMFLHYNWTQGKCNITDVQGHTDNVLSVAFDRRRLASGSKDKSICIWDIKSNHLQQKLSGHSKGIWCLRFFTKNLLISASYDASIKVWNLREGRCVRTLLGHEGPIWAFGLQGSTLVSASQDRTAKIWDISRSVLVHTLRGHSAAVFAVDMDEEGKIAVTGSADRSVRLWNVSSGKLIKVIWASNSTSIMAVSYSKGFVACSYGEVIALYKVEGGKLMRTFNEHEKRIECLELKMTNVDKAEGVMVSGGKDCVVKYWHVQQEKSVQTFRGHEKPINAIKIDETKIVSASYDCKVKIWDFNV